MRLQPFRPDPRGVPPLRHPAEAWLPPGATRTGAERWLPAAPPPRRRSGALMWAVVGVYVACAATLIVIGVLHG